jgi:DNA-directed RNA polymerase subunit RPC12/RpoP
MKWIPIERPKGDCPSCGVGMVFKQFIQTHGGMGVCEAKGYHAYACSHCGQEFTKGE